MAQVIERVAGDEARRVKTGVMIRDDERLSSFFGVDSVKLSSVGVTVATMLTQDILIPIRKINVIFSLLARLRPKLIFQWIFHI